MSSTAPIVDPDFTTGTASSNGHIYHYYTTTNTWPQTWQVWPQIAGGSEDADSGDGDGTSTDDEGATSGGDDDGSKDEGKTFTQEELNTIIAREVSKAQRGKVDAKELGFTSLKEAKEFFDAARQKEEDSKDENAKALEAATKQAQEQARSEVLSVANARVLKAEFLLAAKDHGVEPGASNDAFVIAQTLDLWDEVEIDDQGVVSGFTKEFFADLKKSKPFLFTQPNAGDRDIGAGSRSGGSGDDEMKELKQKYPSLDRTWIS